MKSFTIIAGLMIGLSLSTVASANTLYRWKDAQGVMHYSDKRPPKGVKYVIEVLGEEEASTEESAAPAPPVVEESTACRGARRNLQILSVQGADIMMDTNGDGTTEKLAPEEVGKQQKLAEAQIQAYCVDPSTGTVPSQSTAPSGT